MRKSAATPLVLTLGLVMLLPLQGRSQEGFRAWVGLYDVDQLAWLENENRIGELCRDASDSARCHSEHMRPAISIYSLHREPRAQSQRVGDLLVVAVPGRGLTAHFRSAGSRQLVAFEPDLFLQDWGYGPYFHQTVLAQQGGWFQLPVGPWDRPVWIHRGSDGGSASIMQIQSGDIIEFGGSGFYVIAAEPDVLVLRVEQPADMWCEEGTPPATIAVETRRVPRADLVDSDGRLVIRPRYPKGC